MTIPLWPKYLYDQNTTISFFPLSSQTKHSKTMTDAMEIASNEGIPAPPPFRASPQSYMRLAKVMANIGHQRAQG
jgi:hypothetical protein